MRPARGRLLVRPVEVEETRAGGRVILIADTRERMTLGQCEVVAVGALAECDPERSRAERKCERAHAWLCDRNDTEMYGCCETVRIHLHDFRVGDWLLVRPRAFIDSPNPERREWFVHQDDVIAILERASAPDA